MKIRFILLISVLILSSPLYAVTTATVVANEVVLYETFTLTLTNTNITSNKFLAFPKGDVYKGG